MNHPKAKTPPGGGAAFASAIDEEDAGVEDDHGEDRELA
jgi:hypothetical protein